MKRMRLDLLMAAMMSTMAIATNVSAQTADDVVPDRFPHFAVEYDQNAADREVGETMRQLFWHHYPGAGPKSTFWDGWLPAPSLWPDSDSTDSFRRQWRRALLNRKIDEEGYVSSHQHAGFAHAEGWPFPLHTQGGTGWVFSRINGAFYDDVYGVGLSDSTAGFDLHHLKDDGITHEKGVTLQMTDTTAALTTPAFDLDVTLVPLIRFDWEADNMADDATAFLEWSTAEEPGFSSTNRLPVPLPKNGESLYTHVWGCKHPGWKGRVTQLRLTVESGKPGKLSIRSLIVTFDSRHPVNQMTYLQGCYEYFRWTGDRDFLRRNIERMRKTLDFAFRGFDVEKSHCIRVPWVGHDGRSGSVMNPDGSRTIYHGRGVGGNYWDVLPFGGRECLATIYMYDAMLKIAELEEWCRANPQAGIPANDGPYTPELLREQAAKMKAANGMFWNDETGRFVAAIDVDGVRHDYGFTFVNNEAIFYGYANDEQAASILDWLDGRRLVEGDTSQGDDIYRWRFGPRATTKRNLTYYFWGWVHPESIPFGDQVQDGGAVMGFGFHDLMARVKTLGADNALPYVERNAEWFREVRQAGGYRKYYAPEHGRGNLQGGNVPGGLGLDLEFFESVMYPQIILFGFAGFEAGIDGFSVRPQLPERWSKLAVDRIRWQDQTLALRVRKDVIEIAFDGPEREITVGLPSGRWRMTVDETSQTLDVNDAPIPLKTKPGKILRFTRL